ncbi:MAG: hypothetical protein WBR26_24250 [Candidatus Acidiferrum sp.]
MRLAALIVAFADRCDDQWLFLYMAGLKNESPKDIYSKTGDPG